MRQPASEQERSTDLDSARLDAYVARAWSETDLPQTMFAMRLMQIAGGYAEAPEMEVAGASETPTVCVSGPDLHEVLVYVEEEIANRNHLHDTELADSARRLRECIGGSSIQNPFENVRR